LPAKVFVVSRGGYVALEVIHDHGKSYATDPAAGARYLIAETGVPINTNP
jgi:hypothetical protein